MREGRYLIVRHLLDARFAAYRRRCREDGLDLDRMELWEELLDAALQSERRCPDDAELEPTLLDAIERRYCALISTSA